MSTRIGSWQDNQIERSNCRVSRPIWTKKIATFSNSFLYERYFALLDFVVFGYLKLILLHLNLGVLLAFLHRFATWIQIVALLFCYSMQMRKNCSHFSVSRLVYSQMLWFYLLMKRMKPFRNCLVFVSTLPVCWITTQIHRHFLWEFAFSPLIRALFFLI